MEKEKIEQLISEKLSQREIGNRLDVSQTTIRYYLKKYNLSTTKNPRNRRNRRDEYKCSGCGETDIDKMMIKSVGRKSYSRCKSCHNKYSIKKQRDNKTTLIEYKGGCCERCGYDKCTAALEFHHLDPTQKDTNFTTLKGWGIERAKKEVDKCSLLCSNCHREEHFHLTNTP